MHFSENFKQLRKSKDLTQEEIADIFYVSPKCVSRWETGANYPDVEKLPHIAIFFNVTLDELLGTEKIRDGNKVNEYVKNIRNLLNSGRLYDAIEMSRKAVNEYPVAADNYLHYLLLQALCKACAEDTPNFEENTKKFKNEIIATGERIVNANPGNFGVKQQLVRQYAKWGMKDEAKRILDTMPKEIWDSQEPWAGLLLEGEEWAKNQRSRIMRAKYLLQYYIDGYINDAGLDILRKIEHKNAQLEMEKLIDSISGEEIEPISRVFDNIALAELYCEANDTENAIAYVENATRDAMQHVKQMNKTNETDGGNYYAWATTRNLPWVLWEDHLSKAQFDIVRDYERFEKCFELLKSNSQELSGKLFGHNLPSDAKTVFYTTV